MAAQVRTIDRFWHNRTITGADGMDRIWSSAAGRSWDFAAFPAMSSQRQVLSKTRHEVLG